VELLCVFTKQKSPLARAFLRCFVKPNLEEG
jgi:hypothetical protein